MDIKEMMKLEKHIESIIDVKKHNIEYLHNEITKFEEELYKVRENMAKEIVMNYEQAKDELKLSHWTSNVKLAKLHVDEVILSKKDTEDLLKAIKTARDLLSNINPSENEKEDNKVTYNITINTHGCEKSANELAKQIIDQIKRLQGTSMELKHWSENI